MSTEADWRKAGFSVGDRLFEGEEAVVHVMGWVGRPRLRGRFVWVWPPANGVSDPNSRRK
jgi:hypothetical protein